MTPMMRNGTRVPSRLPQNPGSGLTPFQDSRVPAETRSLSRLMMSWLWVPTQVALILVPLSSAWVI